MAVKLADTLAPMGDFPVAMANDVNITKSDNSEKSLQSMFDDGELGGSDVWTGTKAEYEALDPKPAAGTQVIITDDYSNPLMASGIIYNNNTSGLTSTNMQSALDELYTFAATVCKFDIKVISALPDEGVERTIYFVNKTNATTGDQFDEYLWINSRFELIGNTKVDLSDYAKKSEIPTTLPASDTTSTYSATGTAPVNGKAVASAISTTTTSTYSSTGTAPVNGKAVASAISGKANTSALGTQVTYSLSGTTLTITAK